MCKKIWIALLAVLVLSAQCIVAQAADDNVFYVNYAAPAAGDNCGYIDVYRGLSQAPIITYFWYCSGSDSVDNVTIWLNNDNIGFLSASVLTVGYYSYGKFYYLGTATNQRINDSFSGGLKGYHSYGNVGALSCSVSPNNLDVFTVRNAGSVSSVQVNEIIAALQRSSQDQQENGLDAEQDRSQTAADNSVSQGNSAIPDDSAAVTDGLSSFVQGLSYNGTACSWTMPRVYIPAIAGVMGETTLISEQPIDFTGWLNALPSGVVTVMRAICSVALILYGFKELYGMIEYVLTLRGRGGNDE